MKNPSQDTSIGYIIDLWNPYHRNQNVVSTFKINDVPCCIRKINQYEWGQPIFPEKDIEENYTLYHIYPTLEDAKQYIRELKQIEGVPL